MSKVQELKKEIENLKLQLGSTQRNYEQAQKNADERASKDELTIEKQNGEIQRLEKVEAAVIRAFNEKGDRRCWLDIREVYQAAGLMGGDTSLPPKDEFLANCAKFWQCSANGKAYVSNVDEYKNAFENLCARLDRDGGHAQEGKTIQENLKRCDEHAAALIADHEGAIKLIEEMKTSWISLEEYQELKEQIEECYKFLEQGAHELVQKKIREHPLLTHFMVATRNLKDQRDEIDKLKALQPRPAGHLAGLLFRMKKVLTEARSAFAGRFRDEIEEVIKAIDLEIPN